MKAWRQLLFAVLLILLGSTSALASDIAVVLPVHTELTREFVQSLKQQRPTDRITTHLLDEQPAPESADFIITLGQRALEWRLLQDLETPTLASYITLDGLTRLGRPVLPSSLQLLLASAKPDRQLHLAKLLIPRLSSSGLLYSETQQWQLFDWEQAARRHNLQINSALVEDSAHLPRRLIDLLADSDVLIGLDDPSIYNADQVKTILLTSYARNKVLIGPSAPFIGAGSLSTTYSTPTDMARSLAQLMDMPWVAGRISYPSHFSVLSNPQVARSLGLTLPEDKQLAQLIAAQEQQQ
ncbi:hypothetical protein ACFSB1_06065 [Halopseudomonas phragmitis]|uniref:ABC transporter substrate-binding protein n=1 Tax=Halopseudomonas phragmitis TaxID=1931241 RepID=A0A1V0B7P7_9GAMM|nr:hypothetical protein [Halopseudomonas phragmitis]AQZ95958.1 hypothetical protein BVH74_14885 [Halopseudomonas phragmitis]